MSTFAHRYGASPVHLLAHLVVLPLAAWALLQILSVGGAVTILIWLVGSAIVHDLLLLPFYSLLDRAAERGVHGPAVNLVRVPAGLSLLLALVYFPQIAGKGDPAYAHVAGRHFDAPLERWLLATAALFLLAAIAYGLSRRRSRGGSSS